MRYGKLIQQMRKKSGFEKTNSSKEKHFRVEKEINLD